MDEIYMSNLLVFDDVEGGDLFVSKQCPHCGKFVKIGDLLVNPYNGKIRFDGWLCKKHGAVSTYWTRV